MNELKCPNCGTVFQIDEVDYMSIVKQVKDKYLKGVVDKYRAATKVAIYGIAFYKKECRVNLEIVIV